jgi:hypothetical protein
VPVDLLETPPDLPGAWDATIGGVLIRAAEPYQWMRRQGFDTRPAMRTSDEPRPWAHGAWVGDDWADGRTLLARVRVRATSTVTFDDAVDDLDRACPPSDTISLWVRIPRKGLVRWDVRTRTFDAPTDAAYDVGMGHVDLELFAADPVAYGPGQSATTGFAEAGGGLEFPLFTDGTTDVGYLDFGAPGTSGRVDLSNAGTAEFWPVFRIAGPTPLDGFEIVDVPSGRRIRYTGFVPAGSVLEIDSATGSVILDAVADRSGLLTVREWTAVPAGGSTTIGFVPLGADGSATCTVIWADAWW